MTRFIWGIMMEKVYILLRHAIPDRIYYQWWMKHQGLRLLIDVHTPTVILNYVLVNMFQILLITIFSSLDGYASSNAFKSVFGLVMSLVYTGAAIYYTFIHRQTNPAILYITSELFIWLGSIIASGYRVFSIFLWKQTILIIMKEDKCVNIRHSPSIECINSQTYQRHLKEEVMIYDEYHL